VATPPIDPNVEITANPMGPQPQAPADAPMIEPSTPPLILVELLRSAFILKMFIAKTTPDNADTATINENPKTLSYGM